MEPKEIILPEWVEKLISIKENRMAEAPKIKQDGESNTG